MHKRLSFCTVAIILQGRKQNNYFFTIRRFAFTFNTISFFIKSAFLYSWTHF